LSILDYGARAGFITSKCLPYDFLMAGGLRSTMEAWVLEETQMKLIVAMIRPETLLAVQEALADTEARLMSAAEVSDLRRPQANVYRGSQYRISRVRLRLEIVVADQEAVDRVVEAIGRGAGSNGSGPWGGEDVFVMDLDAYHSAPAKAAYAMHA